MPKTAKNGLANKGKVLIYQVYKRIIYGEAAADYKDRNSTEDLLRREGFCYLPRSKVMQKIIYREEGYEEREVAFPRKALQND